MAQPILTTEQRNTVLEMIASNEPYTVIAEKVGCSVQNIKYYADKYKEKIEALTGEIEAAIIQRGFANKIYRVRKLARLATRIEAELEKEPESFGKKDGLYYTEVKLSSTGDTVEYEVFNAGMVREYRGILDDISKETGGRVTKTELSGDGLKAYINIDMDKV